MESPANADPSKQAAHYTQAEEAVPSQRRTAVFRLQKHEISSQMRRFRRLASSGYLSAIEAVHCAFQSCARHRLFYAL